MSLGSTIAKWRKKKGIKQKDLAVQTGISVSVLSLIEKDRRPPNQGHLEKIGDALGVPYQVLMFLSLPQEDIPAGKRADFIEISDAFKDIVEEFFGQ